MTRTHERSEEEERADMGGSRKASARQRFSNWRNHQILPRGSITRTAGAGSPPQAILERGPGSYLF